MVGTINGNLPRELLGDILLRLPVKVISRCKCVSKQWCFLIESPSFVKQHFEQERNQERLLIRLWEPNQEVDNVNEEPNQNDHEVVQEPDHELFEFEEPQEVDEYAFIQEMMIEQEDPDHEVEEYALYIQQMMIEQEEPDQEVGGYAFIQEMMIEQDEYYRQLALAKDGQYKLALYVDEALSEYEVPYHLQMPDEVTALIGPLNGVFCVVTRSAHRPMALLNPTLRQFKPLPLVQRIYPQHPGLFDSEVGLGLDPLTGDYKLVMLLYFYDMRIEEQHCVVYVCTSESDSWRLLEDVDPIISSRRVCRSFGFTYLNGVHYWLLEDNDTTDVAILAFDMMTEKFRITPVTGPIPDQSKAECLVLCGESLDLFMYDDIERCIDVWMMVSEGCWIRRSRVSPLDSFRWPLCLWKNDELLLETLTGSLTLCNISTHESKIVEAQKVDKGAFLHWVFIYKESLVSIKGEAGKCKLWDPSSDFIKNFFKDASSLRYF